MVNMHGNEKGHLNTEKRKELLDPDKIFKIIGLENGITLADIGCGTGLFSVAASRIVGENSKIYAVDVSDDMLTEVKNKAKAERINNIVAVKSEPYDFKLPDQSVDIALMSIVLHGIEKKHEFLIEAKRVLKHDGKIAIIEFEKAETNYGPSLKRRISSDEVINIVKEAGYQNPRRISLNNVFYIIVAEKI